MSGFLLIPCFHQDDPDNDLDFHLSFSSSIHSLTSNKYSHFCKTHCWNGLSLHPVSFRGKWLFSCNLLFITSGILKCWGIFQPQLHNFLYLHNFHKPFNGTRCCSYKKIQSEVWNYQRIQIPGSSLPNKKDLFYWRLTK